MKQSLYEKIKTIVESGNIAITQREDGHFTLRSSLMDSGEIRRSISDLDIDKCVNYLGGTSQKEYHFLEKKGERYIGIYERPLWRPTKGQKVSVWMEDKWSTIFGEVVDLTSTYAGVKVIDSIHPVPYDCIAPRVEIDTI